MFKLNVAQSQKNTSEKSNVDYDSLNEHIVAQCRAVKPRSIPGVISGIIDLGIQQPEPFDGPVEAGKVYPKDAEYYKDDAGKPCVKYSRKAAQQIALTIDFPQILVDYAKFFTGESRPVPYRMLLNGEFMVKEDGQWVKIVGRGFSLQETRFDDGQWGLPKQNILHRLAEACGVTNEYGNTKPQDVGALLGQYAQFQITVGLTEKSGRKYLNENIKLAGIVPEGLPLPEFDPGLLYGINFTGGNDPDAVRQLRLSVKNTIKRAKNYEGSQIKQDIESPKLASEKPTAPPINTQPQKPKAASSRKQPEPANDLIDDDLPFS